MYGRDVGGPPHVLIMSCCLCKGGAAGERSVKYRALTAKQTINSWLNQSLYSGAN